MLKSKNFGYGIALATIILLSIFFTNFLNSETYGKHLERFYQLKIHTLVKPLDEFQIEFPAKSTDNSIEKEDKQAYKKTTFDKGIDDYHNVFTAPIKGKKKDKKVFLKGSTDEFMSAIADYIYSTFGNVDVTQITIKEFVSEDDETLSYQIIIQIGNDAFSYLCSYNKNYNFYSLYGPY